MGEEKQMSRDEVMAFISSEMKAGSGKGEITQKLVRKGLSSTEASELVEVAYPHFRRVAEKEEVSGVHLLPAIAGGVGAALIGGIIWAVIVVTIEREIGFMALGIGFLCGFGVVLRPFWE